MATPQLVSLKTIIRKRLYFFGVLLLLMIATAAAVFLKKPKTPVEEQPFVSTQLPKPEGIQTVTFASNLPPLPKTVSLYSMSSIPHPPEGFAAELAIKMNLQPATESYLKNIWVNKAAGMSLSISTRGTVTYLADAKINKTGKVVLDQAMAKAVEFIAPIFDTSTLTLDATSVRYTESTGEAESGRINDTAIIPFSIKLGGFPVFYEDALINTATVYVTSNLEVIKAEFSSPPTTFTEAEKKTTLSQDEIGKAITTQKAQLFTNYLVGDRVSINELQSVEITDMQMQYRYTSSSTKVLPYILAAARGKTADGRETSLSFLIPATTE